MKLERPPNPRTRSEFIQTRVSPGELEQIRANAERYCDGSVAEWLRLSAVQYRPEAPKTVTRRPARSPK